MKIIKRGKYYWIDYTKDGKRHRTSTGTSDRKLAQAFMNNLDVARRMPNFAAAVEVLRVLFGAEYDKPKLAIESIPEIYQRIATTTGKVAGENTERMRRNHVAQLLKWLREKRPTLKNIEHINGPVAADYAAHLATKLKTKSRRNIIGDLSSVWYLLEKAAPGITNPWKHLAPPDIDGERGKAFTPAQEQAILAAAQEVGRDWLPICEIMRATGLRYGDVARMRRDHLDGDVIRIKPNKTTRHKIEVVIPILPHLKRVLDAIPARGDYLFPLHADLYGRRAATTRAGLAFKEVLDRAGVKGAGYTIHSWRHTAATRLAEAGVDIETRKRILGHTQDATARRYDHAAHLAETRAALESVIGADGAGDAGGEKINPPILSAGAETGTRGG